MSMSFSSFILRPFYSDHILFIFNHKKLAYALGIEPSTRSFGDSVATLEHGRIWGSDSDLNRDHLITNQRFCQLNYQSMAGKDGLEPSTSG